MKSRIFRYLRSFFATMVIVGEVWIVVGVLLRLTGCRDRFDGVALVYYTTPWPVIAAVCCALAFLKWRQRHIRAAQAHGVLGVAAVIAWVMTTWYTNPKLSAPADFRVVLWNVRNNERDFQMIASRIRELSPDVIALAEAGTHHSGVARWHAAFPEDTVQRLPARMLSLSKTSLEANRNGLLDDGSYFGVLTTEIKGRKITILQTDINARPYRPRSGALKELAGLVREHSGGPMILLGDFNTPRQSWHLDPIRGMLTHAFETRGSGIADTWPLPLPVLSLDQVWLSSALEVVNCRQGWTMLSDHRPVIVDLRFR